MDAAVLFDGGPGACVILIAGEEDPLDSKFPGDRQGISQRPGCMAAAPCRGPDTVADVPALVEEEVGQLVPDGELAKERVAFNDPQVGAGHMPRLARGLRQCVSK